MERPISGTLFSTRSTSFHSTKEKEKDHDNFLTNHELHHRVHFKDHTFTMKKDGPFEAQLDLYSADNDHLIS